MAKRSRKEFELDNTDKHESITKKQKIDLINDKSFYFVKPQWLIQTNEQRFIEFPDKENGEIELFHQIQNKQQPKKNANDKLQINYKRIVYSFVSENGELKCSTATTSDLKVIREEKIELKDIEDNLC